MASKHAVFATCTDRTGERATFRVGRAVDWDRAQARWSRLYPHRAIQGRVRYARRWYAVDFMEVRAVDRHERGLGSDRHERAIPVPYLAHSQPRA
jgi:hypothetical protein